MDEEHQLSNSLLFARWAGEDHEAWQQAVGGSVTHLSRGKGQVTAVSEQDGVVSVHVHYAKGDRIHASWELRTEFIDMKYANGLTRADFIPTVRARRLHKEQQRTAARLAREAARTGER